MFGFLLQLLEFDVLCHSAFWLLVIMRNGEQMVEFGDDETEKMEKYVAMNCVVLNLTHGSLISVSPLFLSHCCFDSYQCT